MALTIPDEYVDWRTKGLWLPGGRLRASEFAAARYDIFTGPFSWPLMVLKRDAMQHNLTTMAEYCRRHGLLLAPHGKTSMAPKLFQTQLAAGAWGITLATANQVLTARGFGVPRIFLANEPEFEFVCYVDSAAGVEALRAALAEVTGVRDFAVVVELGHPGGRTGVRSIGEVVELARAASAVPRLSVLGVAGYEGGLSTVEEASAYLRTLRDAALALADAGALEPDGQLLVSAGGSAYFDAVTDVLAGPWPAGRQTRVLLRSGAYLTHDDGFYAEKTPFNRVDEGALRPAFEIWAQVVSTPEPGLALVGMGKRDAPFDEGLPVVKMLRRQDGNAMPATTAQVRKLNDQHAYLDISDLAPVTPGDLICFGISHPCTAFDKWRVLPMVDERYHVVELIHTYF
jgi:D-serine deaminase-like pyridoxal phosphate-dependent protein